MAWLWAWALAIDIGAHSTQAVTSNRISRIIVSLLGHVRFAPHLQWVAAWQARDRPGTPVIPLGDFYAAAARASGGSKIERYEWAIRSVQAQPLGKASAAQILDENRLTGSLLVPGSQL